MSNNKQQTAVEWYIEKLLDLDYEYAKGLITLGVWSKRKNALIEQAKAMHKQEIKESLQEFLEITLSDEICEEYYNETFGGNQ